MKQHGFTLIELVIVVAMIAILAAIALPSFNAYILKSHRIDAKDALSTVQFAQEKYRANQTTYTATLSDLGITAVSPQKYYTVTISAATATGYTATATATGGQVSDTGCSALSVNQKGFVIDSTATCWGF